MNGESTRDRIRREADAMNRTCAAWYGHGRNDARGDAPYVDAIEFAQWYMIQAREPSHPSLSACWDIFAGRSVCSLADGECFGRVTNGRCSRHANEG